MLLCLAVICVFRQEARSELVVKSEKPYEMSSAALDRIFSLDLFQVSHLKYPFKTIFSLIASSYPSVLAFQKQRNPLIQMGPCIFSLPHPYNPHLKSV